MRAFSLKSHLLLHCLGNLLYRAWSAMTMNLKPLLNIMEELCTKQNYNILPVNFTSENRQKKWMMFWCYYGAIQVQMRWKMVHSKLTWCMIKYAVSHKWCHGNTEILLISITYFHISIFHQSVACELALVIGGSSIRLEKWAPWWCNEHLHPHPL